MRSRAIGFRIGRIAAFVALALIAWQRERGRERLTLPVVPEIQPLHKSGPKSSTDHVEQRLPSPVALNDNGEIFSFPSLSAVVALRLREWEADDDPERRETRTNELERLLSQDRPNIADRLKLIEALPPNLLDFAFGLPSFQQWMFAQPRAALEWISGHPGISEARVLCLFQDWGKQDREELRLYLAQLPPGEWKQKAMTAASYEAMTTNPVEAIVWARQMEPGGPQTGLLEIATTEWARRDARAAGYWVGEVSDPLLRERLLGSLMIGYAETAPDLAAAWTIDLIRTGKILDHSLAEVAGIWAQQDPAATAKWVANFPAGEGRQMALGNLLTAWENRDPSAALAWANGLVDPALRAQAIQFVDLSGNPVAR